MTLNDTLRMVNDAFFEWYVRGTPWFKSHARCETCDERGATKACFVAFQKTLPVTSEE